MSVSKVHPYLFLSDEQKEAFLWRIVRLVGEFYNLQPTYYRNKTQKHAYIRARHVAAYIIRFNSNLSLSKIGNYIGRITHASVLHAINSIKNESLVNHTLAGQLKDIQSVIYNEISAIINEAKEQPDNRQCMINLNDFTSFRLEGNRFIIAVGFEDRDLDVLYTMLATKERRNHVNTGILIFDDNTTQGQL